MSIEKIVAEAIDNNPLKLKEAFEEEMNLRIHAILEEKYKKMMKKEEDEDDEDDELEEGSIKGSGTDRKAQLKKAYRSGEQDTRQFNTPGGYATNKPKGVSKDKNLKHAYQAGRDSSRGDSAAKGVKRSAAQDELNRAKRNRYYELSRRARQRGDFEVAKKHTQAAMATMQSDK